MRRVQVTCWTPGFQTISFLKLLRVSGARSLSLAEAKDLVDRVLASEPVSVDFRTDEEAADFVCQAIELGAVASTPEDIVDEMECCPQVPSETDSYLYVDVSSVGEEDIDSLADAWLACWRLPINSPERAALQWISDLEYELLKKAPELLWLLILAVHGKNQTPRVQEVLAAGPLEDLLGRYGAHFIARVEAKARFDPSFARLLGGVWKSTIPNEVWLRVQTVWNRSGWDGIPS